MSEQEALSLLYRKLPDEESTDTKALDLVKELECLPLAIIQAAAYISVQRPVMSIPRYLDLYRDNEAQQIELLAHDEGDLTRDPGVPHSVLTTWQISFEQIQAKSPWSSNMLSFVSMFDRHKISRILLEKVLKSALPFQSVLKPLGEFWLVTLHKDGQSIEIHRLVQLACKKWLQQSGRLETWQNLAIVVITDTYGTLEALEHAENFPDEYMPHIQEICEVHQSDRMLVQGHKPPIGLMQVLKDKDFEATKREQPHERREFYRQYCEAWTGAQMASKCVPGTKKITMKKIEWSPTDNPKQHLNLTTRDPNLDRNPNLGFFSDPDVLSQDPSDASFTKLTFRT